MSWQDRVRLRGLEIDAQSLAHDPIRNREALQTLTNVMTELRRRLGADADYDFAMALDLSYGDKRVRVIVDNPRLAAVVERAWLLNHPGGGCTKQRAEYSAWAAPLLNQLHAEQRKAS